MTVEAVPVALVQSLSALQFLIGNWSVIGTLLFLAASIILKVRGVKGDALTAAMLTVEKANLQYFMANKDNIVGDTRLKTAYDLFRSKVDEGAPFWFRPFIDLYLNEFWSFDKRQSTFR